MRLAHIADTHLGFRQFHRVNARGINQREADVAGAFRSAVDGVIAARPDLVVIAGDLFHSVKVGNRAIIFAVLQFQRLRRELPGVPIIVIPGNHDTPRTAEAGSILHLLSDIGIEVAITRTRRFVYPHLDLSVTAVPYFALAGGLAQLESATPERFRVLLLHGEVEGMFHGARKDGNDKLPGKGTFRLAESAPDDWNYVALGDYHVQHRVAPNIWYAGSLEYVSPNIWGEIEEEGQQGKGWLLVDLERRTVERVPVPAARRILDLEGIDAEHQQPSDVQAMIVERILAVPGGIDDAIVRLKVHHIPHHVSKEMDTKTILKLTSPALDFRLDLRRPIRVQYAPKAGAPGETPHAARRAALPELLANWLANWKLPAGLDRERFVREGMNLLSEGDK